MILYAPFAARTPNLSGAASPKDYPFAEELIRLLEAKYDVLQVGGGSDRQLAKKFVSPSFKETEGLITKCDTAVCVDSYLQHHMWLMGRKAVVVWGIGDPKIFGHNFHVNLLKDRSYLRRNQFDWYYSNENNPDAFVGPDVVMDAVDSVIAGGLS